MYHKILLIDKHVKCLISAPGAQQFKENLQAKSIEPRADSSWNEI